MAIHAEKQKPNIYDCKDKRVQAALTMSDIVIIQNLPLGEVIAIAELVDCIQVVKGTYNTPTGAYEAILENGQHIGGNEIYFGDLSPGCYAWMFANVRQIDPVPAKGKQRLWEWEGIYDLN